MGYAKNPGSFKDTVGMLIVLLVCIQFVFAVFAAIAGDITLFWTLQIALYTAIKEAVWSLTSLILMTIALLTFLILYFWKDSPNEK
jgi:hypothetical protein